MFGHWCSSSLCHKSSICRTLAVTIFTTGQGNSISRASSCPLTLSASGKSFLSLGVRHLRHYTLFTITNVHNEFRKARRDTHHYTELHLQFLCSLQSTALSHPHRINIYKQFTPGAVISFCFHVGLIENRERHCSSRGRSLKFSSHWTIPFTQVIVQFSKQKEHTEKKSCDYFRNRIHQSVL